MNWLFLAVGGFLIGTVLYTGYYTTRYEPDVKRGYLIIGAGVVIVVTINAWVDITRDTPHWFRLGTLLGYTLIAMGLVLVIRVRRRMHHDSNEKGRGG